MIAKTLDRWLKSYLSSITSTRNIATSFAQEKYLRNDIGVYRCHKSMRFSVAIEKIHDSYYIGTVLELSGCHKQAKTLDELMERIQEAIKLYLEVEGVKQELEGQLVGVQLVEIKTIELKTSPA